MQGKPYFMTNKSWYYFDQEEWRYKLTDSAPPDAQKSYEEFYNTTAEVDGKKVEIDY